MYTMRYTDNDKTIYAALCCFCVHSVVRDDVSCTFGLPCRDHCAQFAPIGDITARMKELVEKLPDKYYPFRT